MIKPPGAELGMNTEEGIWKRWVNYESKGKSESKFYILIVTCVPYLGSNTVMGSMFLPHWETAIKSWATWSFRADPKW